MKKVYILFLIIFFLRIDLYSQQNTNLLFHWEDTTLVLTTDHGFMLGEHDWWAKNRMPMYNEIAHIPLFIYHPDYKEHAGETRDTVTQNIDLMPTFLSLNNLNIPEEVKGKSIINFLQKDTSLFENYKSILLLSIGYKVFFFPQFY